MTLTPQDLRDILKVLDESPYDELTLDTERFSLTLKRSEKDGSWQQQVATPRPERTPGVVTENAPGEQMAEPEASEPGLLDVRAPMPGTFYRAPKPNADPFVTVGSTVESDSVIAIIEVMKLMNAIPAGVSGEVVEVLVEDATLVARGQLLMRVRAGRTG